MANSPEQDLPEKVKSKRMFINHVDQYEGRNLAKYLSKCVVGSSMDEAEEEEDAHSTTSSMIPEAKEGCYQIIGTLKNRALFRPDYVKEVILYENKDQLYDFLLECDVIVYDITEDPDQIDEAVWAVSELHSDLDKLQKAKMFILISSCMTWAKSKPLDPDDPEIPFTEDDYRRRKPHPNFKEHTSAEKTVIKLGKTNKAKLVTYVICSGLTYGAEQNIFHYLFKSAWHNQESQQLFGNGQNIVPTIHIKDLASVVQNIADSRPKVRYIIAKDDGQNNLEEIVKAVSSELGSGKVKSITKEEALLSKDIEQADFDMLLVNLRMDAVHMKESMHINWVSEGSMIENMRQIVKEFKDSRNLQPIRVVILGSPASGKSTVAQHLCEHYKLHHIKIKEVIDDALENLQAKARRADTEDAEEDDGSALEAQDLYDQIVENKETNSGRIDDQFIIRFFREKLKSMPCQNQGFILDGFPKTLDQAKELFANEEDEENDESSKETSFDKTIIPEFVISFEATDDFLKQRVMNLPESVVGGTHNTEAGLQRRLAEYKAVNTEDETVLNYFDELEFHPHKIDVTKDTSEMMQDTTEVCKKIIGVARNYGPTADELEEIKRKEEEARLKKEAEEKSEQERQEAEEAAEKKKRQEEWGQRLCDVQREEYEMLEAKSVPLRNFLMKHVMPTLTQGLMDCCKVRPDDPIDYLAEYLFQNNPQVD